jgi:hypothetical protein
VSASQHRLPSNTWELKPRDEVFRCGVIGFGTNLSQRLLERQDEVDREAGFAGNLRIGA